MYSSINDMGAYYLSKIKRLNYLDLQSNSIGSYGGLKLVYNLKGSIVRLSKLVLK